MAQATAVSALPTFRSCQVVANASVTTEHALVTLAGPLGANATPGQFAQVSFAGVSGTLLPRPFSFHRAESDYFQLLSHTIGPGTAALAASRPGDELTILGPLGHGFDLSALNRNSGEPNAIAAGLLLVGGGVSVPPLHHAAAFIRAGQAK